jgi:hypothetical protein
MTLKPQCLVRGATLKGTKAMRKSIPCTLALAAFASASVHAATNSRSITLDITYSDSGYSCVYNGGDNPAGDVTFHVGTTATVALHVTGDRSYTIESVDIKSDPNDQLSIPSSSPTTAVIQDKNTVAQTAVYKVMAKDPDGTGIPCDPKIINN